VHFVTAYGLQEETMSLYEGSIRTWMRPWDACTDASQRLFATPCDKSGIKLTK